VFDQWDGYVPPKPGVGDAGASLVKGAVEYRGLGPAVGAGPVVVGVVVECVGDNIVVIGDLVIPPKKGVSLGGLVFVRVAILASAWKKKRKAGYHYNNNS
jgi:hypothetical protein